MSDNHLILPCPVGEVSDGYHTFNELYDHRCTLFVALLTLIPNSWYSEKHHDGSELPGWFIAGVELEKDTQITYHLPNRYLRIASERLYYREFAPEWDGYTSDDVLTRLTNWIDNGSRLMPVKFLDETISC